MCIVSVMFCNILFYVIIWYDMIGYYRIQYSKVVQGYGRGYFCFDAKAVYFILLLSVQREQTLLQGYVIDTN